MIRELFSVLVATSFCLAGGILHAQEKSSLTPISIAKVKRSAPVDFEREVLPILKANCLACHNKTTTKGELVLETPQDMTKGGESGRAIIPKNGSDSLLLKLASHQKRPIMPPRDNKAAAANLTPQELGIIKLWIDQGAKGSVRNTGPVEWKPLPETFMPIYAVSVTADGQFAAAARANQIHVYHLPSGQFVTRLADPQMAKTNGAQAGVAHRDIVQSLAFSPDGNVLASGGYREVKIWRRVTDAQKFNPVSAGRKEVTAVATSPDGRLFATGGDDGGIKLWDAMKVKSVRNLSGHKGEVTVLKFSADGAQMLSASADKTVRIWMVAGGKSLLPLVTSNEVSAAAWIHDGKGVAVGGGDQIIRLWQVPVGAKDPWVAGQELKGHSGVITALEWRAEGKQLVSGSADGALRLWDVAKGESVREIKHGAPVLALAVRADGKRIASTDANGVVKLWEPTKGELVAEIKGDRKANELAAEKLRYQRFATNEVAFRKTTHTNAITQQKAAGERVKKGVEGDESAAKALAEKQKALKDTTEARAAADKTVGPLNDELKQATELAEAADKALKQAEAEAKAIQGKTDLDKAAAEKAKGEASAKTKLANAAKAEADKKLSEAKNKQKPANDKLTAADKAMKDAEAALKKAEMTKSNAAHELELAKSAQTKADGAVAEAVAAIATAEAALQSGDAALQAARKAMTEAQKAVNAVAFSANGKTLATAGEDQMVHLWNGETGAAYDRLKGHKGSVQSLAFTADGGVISGGADRLAIVWDLGERWKLERTIGTGDAASPLADRVNALRFSPDGQVLATGGGEPTRGGEIKLWQWSTGKLVQDFKNMHSDAVFSLDFSPDGKLLASGAADKFMRVVEISTGKVVKAFEGHTSHVLGVSWKRDGRTLASAGADNVVKVWDFVTGERRKNVEGFGKEVTAVQFVGYTDQIVASAGDNQVRLVNEKGEQVRAYGGAADFVSASGVSADGSVVVAGGLDSVLRVWNGTNGQAVGSWGAEKVK